MSISEGEVLLRLAVALVLCGALGLEREARDEVAGLRTLALVGLGAAAFTIVSAHGFDGAAHDPTRIAAQVVSGVGFLGAGAIVREGFTVRGVTTAAALWISAAVGMAAGAGAYFAAVATAAVALVALVVFRRFRATVARRLGTDAVVLDLELLGGSRVRDVGGALARRGIRVTDMRTQIAGGVQTAELAVRVPAAVDLDAVLSDLAALPDVARVGATGIRLVEGGSG